MPGNQKSMRPSNKKGPTKGSGGKRARGLRGKGPTPKAEDRVYHSAYKKKLEREEARKRAAQREAARTYVRKELRLNEGYELISGRNPVVEALRAGVPLTRVFMVSSAVSDERLATIVRAATAAGAPLLEVTRTELDRMTDNSVHQGVAIEVPPFAYTELDDLLDTVAQKNTPGLIVALDSVTDPHNLGAVLRSASAFGVDGVIIPERRSASVNAVVWKVSAGAAARVPVVKVPNLVRSLEKTQKCGYFVVGLDGGGSEEVPQLRLADMPLVLVTGSEGKGLARLTRERCDVIASIPMRKEMESLNAAVATGIALYQIDRLRTEIFSQTTNA